MLRSRRPLPVHVLAIAVACVVLAACGGTSDGDTADRADAVETHTVEADNGEIEVPIAPERVVATGYAVPVLIEAGASLVGISTWERGLALMTTEDRRTYDDLDKVSGETADSVDYEAVAAARPDLIVVGVPAPVLADVDVERLEQLAPVVAIGPSEPDEWRQLSQRQSEAAGRGEEYAQARREYEEQAEQLSAKYSQALKGTTFGHLGGYGQVDRGTFMREYAGSWGTNIAGDIGVEYPGEPAVPGEGSAQVSEYPSLEQLPESFADSDVVTYSVQPDGTPSASVQAVLDSPLWQQIPAVRAGRAYPVPLTEAATYPSARRTLASLDEALSPLLEQ